jgi:phosphoglycolate phosphatase
MDLLIFDLDGTLIDSRLDLALSVNAARAHMGLPPLDNELVASYVGNGAPMLIRRAMPADATDTQLEEALEYFLEHYRDHALDNTRLYPGVREAVDRLSAAGKRLAVLTNKPVKVSRTILSGLGVGGSFFQVYGGNSFDFKKPNPVGVEALMKETGVDRDGILLVGDSAIDILTARNAGVRSCGVTYGFQPDSLADPAPDLLVDDIRQVADWVLNNGGNQ